MQKIEGIFAVKLEDDLEKEISLDPSDDLPSDYEDSISGEEMVEQEMNLTKKRKLKEIPML